jgi:serine/threonine protein kinase
MEYVAGGSLRARLKEFGPLEGAVLRKATRGLLKGLKYLHTHDPPVVHRDLKGANVLVDEDFHVKLADFGCSKRDVCTQSFSTIGSVHWMAPEVLKAEGYGRCIDIWSFGCVIVEMVTAEDPWGKDAFASAFQAMHRICFTEEVPHIPIVLPDDGRDLVCQCLQRKPTDRPTALELIEHSFLQRPSNNSSKTATT